MQTTKTQKIQILALAWSALVLTGCGKTAFVVSDSNIKAGAPGAFIVPAKVDVLLAEDDTGSIKEIYGSIANQMPQFLNGLTTRGWDYHFATTGLSTDRVMNQVLASQHDTNWCTSFVGCDPSQAKYAYWTPPYPGAPFYSAPGTVNPANFTIPDYYSGFLSYEDTSSGNGGIEDGFETIRKTLYERQNGTNFLRSDAMLVVVSVGNGDDTSKVNYCNRGDGVTVPCESIAGTQLCTDISQAGAPGSKCGSKALSLAWYQSQFQALKTGTSQFKYFAAAADGSANCLGGPSYYGDRYIRMAQNTGGVAYNVCAASVSSILDSIATHLHNTRLALRTRYVFVDKEPEVSSIKVTKYVGGSVSQSISIPQDATNGWTYAGNVTNVYAIDYPVPMNISSGWAIELHGSAKLVGDDTADITFRQKGLQNADN